MPPLQRFAVFGHPVAHSLSPAMHNANFKALGYNAVYEACDVTAETFAATAGEFRSGGINCTIPLKRIAFEYCARRDISAERFGVVNTIRFEDDGTTTGFNTDGIGFLNALAEELECTPKGRDVFIFGCGGAGRAIAITCADAGARSITLANRSPARMERLAKELKQLVPHAKVNVTASHSEAWKTACRAADLVVQCTSIGLHADDILPLSAEAFTKEQKVYDLVYAAPITPTMAVAQLAGAATANGLGMLVHQGAASFTIWTGLPADIIAMRAAIASRAANSGGG